MAQFTITIGSKTNNPPNQIGDLFLTLDYNELYVFSINDFTINTVPVYVDPDGDLVENIKIISLPSVGTLTNDGINVSINDEISRTVIESGLLKYQCDPSDLDGYVDTDTTFDISDEGSSTYSGLTPGVINITVGAKPNDPPSQVGDGSAVINYGETLVFTSAMFTTDTTPIYIDPEGDAALLLKILSLPTDGEIQLNGVAVTINQVISFTDIDNGLLTYVPDLVDTNGDVENFTFSIADAGSGIFTS